MESPPDDHAAQRTIAGTCLKAPCRPGRISPRSQPVGNTAMTRSETVVLVTGASSGFGAAIAEALQARGFCVYGTARAVPAPETGGSYRPIAMDVDSDASVAAGIEGI